jgi:hypothetical protein
MLSLYGLKFISSLGKVHDNGIQICLEESPKYLCPHWCICSLVLCENVNTILDKWQH